MKISVIIEIAGYLGSVLVVVSMLMSSVVKLRVINTIGSSISAAYALVIHSYPLALMNICLVIINIYNLMKLLKPEQHYSLVNGKTDDKFLAYFLDFYNDDIKNFFPEKDTYTSKANIAYIICCGINLVGLLLGQMDEDGVLNICIDYTTPEYRDCSVGKFLYPELAGNGIHRFVFSAEPGKHEQYLLKMGFKNKNGIYIKNL